MNLADKVLIIKGIGTKTEKYLSEMGINTIQQLIDYYPFRYEDRTYTHFSGLNDGETVTVKGIINSRPNLIRRNNKSQIIATIEVVIQDNNNHITNTNIKAVWFNQPYLIKELFLNRSLSITGKYSTKYKNITVSSHEFDTAQKVQLNSGMIVPIYMRHYQITTNQLRKWIYQCLTELADKIDEILPKELIDKYRLTSKEQAYKWIHFPENAEQKKQAYRRLVFEEFFFYQIKLQLYRNNYKSVNKYITRRYNRRVIDDFIEQLDFTLTKAQLRVIDELLLDIENNKQMYRLLHGDVGSGKTIVATIIFIAIWTCEMQSALMVPTEILADQHYNAISKLTKKLGINCCLLKGGLNKKERELLLNDIKTGKIDIIIGTHALLQADVEFKQLGLVVVDEQHRFGVEQRAILTNKDDVVDVLNMSATPIPRTLAMTIYGDIDISVIDEYPEGRKYVQTIWHGFDKIKTIYEKMFEILKLKQQIYIVCPLIEESDVLNINDVENVFKEIHQVFNDFRVGILHGRLSNDEKDNIMQKFKDHKIDIIVSTTVIEVGVNVPNASMIVIYNAERFGLTQLHQLRGRVGRGNYQGYCYLVADAKSQSAKQRMQVMVECNDGFYIAEKDLELRGPGEIIGNRQSGIPLFKIGNLIDDYNIMTVARDEAKVWINNKAFVRDLINLNLGINFLA